MLPLRTILRTAACSVLALPAAAQWAPTPHVPGSPVIAEGFLVLHENAGGVNVFSAAARQWRPLAPPGSPVLGTGDWTVLVRDQDALLAYSARRNDVAPLFVTGPVAHVAVDDDVALVFELPLAGPPLAHGYSAVTNTWSSVPLGFVPAISDFVISRFVIGVRDESSYHGFAARTGAWATLPTIGRGAVPQADGNVLLADLFDPVTGSGSFAVAAFSGVRGNWAVSPPYDPGNHNVLLDHNVAYMRADAGAPAFFATGYSAYLGQWISSPFVQTFGPMTLELIRDNVVYLPSFVSTTTAEAFGSLPGVWAQLPGAWLTLVHEESYVVLWSSSGVPRLEAFSGECMGAWTTQNVFGVAAPVGAGDHSALIQVGNQLYGFSPASSTWAAPLSISAAAVVTNEDALSDVRDTFFGACTTRRGAWAFGPLPPAGTVNTVSAGSVIVHQVLTGSGSGDLYVFDERTNTWPAPFNPGGVSLLTLGRNLVVSELPGAASPIVAYSVQRGNWLAPPGFLGPVSVAPVAEENVAHVVDAQGLLWAFGSPNDGHVWHAWPNGTEYHTSGKAPFGNVPFVAYGVQGNPGDLVWANFALKTIQPPLVIPGIGGSLCLDPTVMWSLGFWGAVDADQLLEQLLYVFTPLPPCVQLWFQPLILDVATLQLRWGHRCDPGWFF